MPKTPSIEETIRKPKLIKLKIKNYRCIGATPVEIDLDDIVILVGANNVGKSSILKAYELVMSDGSKNAHLTINDFPNNCIDAGNLPEIELHTIAYDNSPGEMWLEKLPDGGNLVKERWIWSAEGKPERQGWDVKQNEWSKKVPWGAANFANSKRPEPHRIDAFASPEDQANEIKKLLTQILNERVQNLKEENQDNEEENDYKKLLTSVKELQKKIVLEASDEVNEVNRELTESIEKVFPNYRIEFDAKPEDDLDKTISLFKADGQLLMGPSDGFLSSIERQGSGARRTLLWIAIKFISENNARIKNPENIDKTHLMLIDEPEICLHPNAIREACKVLYDLPNSSNWQVMATTHSPIFIDFSRDNTTIIKVDKNKNGEISGTTVFKPSNINLDPEDKKNLKMLNICDPYMAEFFFGGKVIVVEGDTEYTAFNCVIENNFQEYRDIHIIRARGKATIVSLIKILNHFGSDYSVLHDSDLPKTSTKEGKEITNPAWTNNLNILNAINEKPEGINTRLIASLPNFEKAYLDSNIKTEKPYNALKILETDKDKFDIVEKLLKALIDHSSPLPNNCSEWSSIEELEKELGKE